MGVEGLVQVVGGLGLYLQFKLGLQNDVDAGLPEAVRLLEFAHRDECRDCPQSVCAVQDLAIAYGMADGPAYAAERRQVCAETLERIDPGWPCFDCLSGEYGYALLDQGRFAEAVEYLDAQARRLRAETGDSLSGYSTLCLARAHLEQGNPEAARKLSIRRFPTSSFCALSCRACDSPVAPTNSSPGWRGA